MEAREGRLFSSSSSSRSRKAKRVMRRKEANFFFSLARSLFFFSLYSPSFYFFIRLSFFLFLSHFSDLQLSIDGGENKKKGRGERGGRGPVFSKKGVLRGGCICSTFCLCFWCFLVVARGDKREGGQLKVPAPAVASIFERFDSFHFGWKRRGGVFDVIFCIFLPEFFCCFSQLSFLSARDFISKTTEFQC